KRNRFFLTCRFTRLRNARLTGLGRISHPSGPEARPIRLQPLDTAIVRGAGTRGRRPRMRFQAHHRFREASTARRLLKYQALACIIVVLLTGAGRAEDQTAELRALIEQQSKLLEEQRKQIEGQGRQIEELKRQMESRPVAS